MARDPGRVTAWKMATYMPPPEEPINLATAFTREFLKASGPYEQALFAKRLEALDPAGQASALAALDEQAAAIIESSRKGQADAMKYSTDANDQALQWQMRQSEHQQAVDVANIGATEAKYTADRRFASDMAALQDVDAKSGAAIQGFVDTATTKGREIVELTKAIESATTPDEVARLVQARTAAGEELIRARTDAIKGGRAAGLNTAQLGTVDAKLKSDAQALGVPASVEDVWDRRKADQKLVTTWAPPPAEGGVGGRAHLVAAPPLGADGSVSVSMSSSEGSGSRGVPDVESPVGGGAAPSDFAAQAERGLAMIEADKARIRELYQNPYGGFNDPLPGTKRNIAGGLFGGGAADAPAAPVRPTREQMAGELTATMAKQRGLPVPPAGTSAAADATPPAVAEAARQAAASEAKAGTLSARVSEEFEAQDEAERVAKGKKPTSDYYVRAP